MAKKDSFKVIASEETEFTLRELREYDTSYDMVYLRRVAPDYLGNAYLGKWYVDNIIQTNKGHHVYDPH